MNDNQSSKYKVNHPGVLLRDTLSENRMTQKELADILGKSTPFINDIIKGKRSISVEMAVMLQAALGIKADIWLSLQNAYDLQEAEKDEDLHLKRKAVIDWNNLKSFVNCSYLKKRLGLGNDVVQNVNSVFSCLNVASVSDLERQMEQKFSKFFRKSDKFKMDSVNLFTWLTVVRHRSELLQLDKRFDKRKVSSLVSKLNLLFFRNSDNLVDEVTGLMGDYGIKFFIEPKLEKMPVDGFSFWEGSNPTIVLTCRYNRIDNFAFNIMHELGHVKLHLSPENQQEFIETDVHEENEIEAQADLFAEQSLSNGAPVDDLFRSIHNPFTAEERILGFSEEYKINPGILTGRYQYYCGIYTIARNLISTVKLS